MSKENTTENIMAYLNGEFSDLAKDQFETDMQENPALKREVEELLAAKAAVIAEARAKKKEEFSQLYHIDHQEDTNKKKKTMPLWTWSAIAASILLLVLAGYLLLGSASLTSQEGFAQYYERPNIPEVFASPLPSENMLREAHRAFSNSKFEEAAVLYQEVTRDSVFAKKPQAYFYLGICHLENGENEKAIKAFEQSSANNSQADWYIALTHLHAGDSASAREQLQKITEVTGHFYGEKATELLKKLAD